MLRRKGVILTCVAILFYIVSSCTADEVADSQENLEDGREEKASEGKKIEAAATISHADLELANSTIPDSIRLQQKRHPYFSQKSAISDGDMFQRGVLNDTGTCTNEDRKAEIYENEENKSTEVTSPSKSRWICNLMSLVDEDEENKAVILKNETELGNIVSRSNENQSCFLLYFFVKWCELCAEFSVEINAIGRIFYGLPVIAVDSYSLSGVAAKFGITGVPSLILFYNGRPVAKFNRSRTLQGLDDFVTQSTGLTANRSVEITDADFAGPLSTKADKQGDIYLVLSIASVTIVALINFCLTDRVSSAVASSIDKFKAWAIHQKRD